MGKYVCKICIRTRTAVSTCYGCGASEPACIVRETASKLIKPKNGGTERKDRFERERQ